MGGSLVRRLFYSPSFDVDEPRRIKGRISSYQEGHADDEGLPSSSGREGEYQGGATVNSERCRLHQVPSTSRCEFRSCFSSPNEQQRGRELISPTTRTFAPSVLQPHLSQSPPSTAPCVPSTLSSPSPVVHEQLLLSILPRIDFPSSSELFVLLFSLRQRHHSHSIPLPSNSKSLSSQSLAKRIRFDSPPRRQQH